LLDNICSILVSEPLFSVKAVREQVCDGQQVPWLYESDDQFPKVRSSANLGTPSGPMCDRQQLAGLISL